MNKFLSRANKKKILIYFDVGIVRLSFYFHRAQSVCFKFVIIFILFVLNAVHLLVFTCNINYLFCFKNAAWIYLFYFCSCLFQSFNYFSKFAMDVTLIKCSVFLFFFVCVVCTYFIMPFLLNGNNVRKKTSREITELMYIVVPMSEHIRLGEIVFFYIKLYLNLLFCVCLFNYFYFLNFPLAVHSR